MFRTKLKKGRIVAFISVNETLGAMKTAKKDWLVMPEYPPQPASESLGCSRTNSVATVCATSGFGNVTVISDAVTGRRS